MNSIIENMKSSVNKLMLCFRLRIVGMFFLSIKKHTFTLSKKTSITQPRKKMIAMKKLLTILAALVVSANSYAQSNKTVFKSDVTLKNFNDNANELSTSIEK